MSKSGGASRQGASKPVMRVSERRATTKTAKTPEQTHAEKIARAEDVVRKAQARADDIERRNQESLQRQRAAVAAHPNDRMAGFVESLTEGHGLILERMDAEKALKGAQTRLANLRTQNPNHTPAQRAHEAKSRAYEAKIAKARDALARLEAEYAAHQRGATGQTAAPVPRPSGARGAPSTRPARETTPAALASRLTAVNRFEGRAFNPTRMADPYFVRALYGDKQLREALSLHTTGKLREVASELGVRPGRTRESVVDALVAKVQRTPYDALVAHYRRNPNQPYWLDHTVS